MPRLQPSARIRGKIELEDFSRDRNDFPEPQHQPAKEKGTKLVKNPSSKRKMTEKEIPTSSESKTADNDAKMDDATVKATEPVTKSNDAFDVKMKPLPDIQDQPQSQESSTIHVVNEEDVSLNDFASRVSSWQSKFGSEKAESETDTLGHFTKKYNSLDNDKDTDMLSDFGFSDAREGSEKANDEAEGDLRQQVQQLQGKLARLNVEKSVADERADKAMEKVQELKKMLDADLVDLSQDAASVGNDVDKLKRENRALQEKLRDTQSHIFSLQPYRKDLTAEEVGKQYDELVESIEDWVRKLMDPLLDDPEKGFERILSQAKKRPLDLNRFKKAMQPHPDLVSACTFPETEEDIIVAMIMRFIHDEIFQKVAYGAIQQYTGMIAFVENLMQSEVKPKRDLFAVRTWTGEAYNALLSAHQFEPVRNKQRRNLTADLAGILCIFTAKDDWQELCEGLDEACIRPAMALYEKLAVSTHHFYLDINTYMSWSRRSGHIACSGEFYNQLNKLYCKNTLQNRKVFSLAKIDPAPSNEELRENLENICTVVPALYMRQIGQKDSIKEPSIVRKQKMLVAWGNEEKRKKMAELEEKSIVGQLFFAKIEKFEGWASSFKWGEKWS